MLTVAFIPNLFSYKIHICAPLWQRTLQTSFENSAGKDGLSALKLDSLTIVNTRDSTRVVVAVSDEFLNAIKQDKLICTVTSNCYVVILKSFVKDMSGNQVQQTELNLLGGQRVQSLGEDKSSPKLLSFSMNLVQSWIALTFSETMLASSILAGRHWTVVVEAGI